MVLKSFPRMVTLVTELKSKTPDVLIHQCIFNKQSSIERTNVQ